MDREDICLKFFNNPKMNPVTNKPINNYDYKYYKNKCEKIGYYKNYRWQKVNKSLSPIYKDRDLLYNVLLNTDIKDVFILCNVNKLATDICHSKDFLTQKLSVYHVDPTYENLVYLDLAVKITKMLKLKKISTFIEFMCDQYRDLIRYTNNTYKKIHFTNVNGNRDRITTIIHESDILSHLIGFFHNSCTYHIALDDSYYDSDNITDLNKILSDPEKYVDI